MQNTELVIKANTEEEKNALQEYSALPAVEQIPRLVDQARTIIITDIAQTELMSTAHRLRITLKNIRTAIDARRKELKEKIVSRGKAIDGMANILKDIIVPVEKHLENQAKFVERLEEKRLEELSTTRNAALAPYLAGLSCYDLEIMSEQGFNQLLESSKIAFKAQREAERKAEEERQAQEKAEAEAHKFVCEENERLKREQAERDKAEAKLRVAECAKFETERKAKETAEAETQAVKAEQERKEREIVENKAAEEKAQKEAATRATRAPDKAKLHQLAIAITAIEMPKVKSQEAQKTVDDVVGLLNKTTVFLTERIARM